MSAFSLRSLVVAGSMATALAAAPAFGRQVVQEHAGGLLAPAKLLALPSGELLVAEAGNGPNTGRVSYIDRAARRFTVIDGLPSALFLGREPSGPAGLLLVDRRLYIVIGGGDTTLAGAGMNSEIPNPTPASPLFSSVLLLEFPDAAGPVPLGYTLDVTRHEELAADRAVYLWNVDGEAVRVSRLVDFPSYVAEPRPDEPRHVRTSNPYGIVGSASGIAVVDASMNAVWTVPLAPGGPATMTTRFPPVPNPLFPTLGPPVADAVPASLRVAGDDFVVSYLTGFPFGPGAASVVRVGRDDGAITPLAAGLQTAIDLLPLSGTTDQFYVLEYSNAFLTGGPGRLLRVDAGRGTRLVLAEELRTPTHMAIDTRSGDLFVSEMAAGRIVRVLLPR